MYMITGFSSSFTLSYAFSTTCLCQWNRWCVLFVSVMIRLVDGHIVVVSERGQCLGALWRIVTIDDVVLRTIAIGQWERSCPYVYTTAYQKEKRPSPLSQGPGSCSQEHMQRWLCVSFLPSRDETEVKHAPEGTDWSDHPAAVTHHY